MFLSVDFRLQMLMERSLLAIVSLMVFQIFEALYINCELGSGVIIKAFFCLIVGIKNIKILEFECVHATVVHI